MCITEQPIHYETSTKKVTHLSSRFRPILSIVNTLTYCRFTEQDTMD